MNRINISDGEWVELLANLRKLPGIHVGSPETCRRFVGACLWILRSGSQWRILPPTHGKWNSIFKRFSRWCANGAWGNLLSHFSEQADLQDVSMDGSVVRAHACAAGAAGSAAEKEALGRSKGGFSCKIHALCDALGMPIKYILTGGQEAECQQAIPLLENVKALAVLADKAYDTDVLRAWLKCRGIKAVIPPKSNRKEKIECDYWHYKERHAVECLFGKLKHYRRIATRYEKKAINYMGMLSFASVLLWLR
ncbi:MAG: IS5/IS1182 family transposase [Methylobacter sp.]|nr:MAG: IS5/IS1182 family transposase [Methylobacter sp.]